MKDKDVYKFSPCSKKAIDNWWPPGDSKAIHNSDHCIALARDLFNCHWPQMSDEDKARAIRTMEALERDGYRARNRSSAAMFRETAVVKYFGEKPTMDDLRAARSDTAKMLASMIKDRIESREKNHDF